MPRPQPAPSTPEMVAAVFGPLDDSLVVAILATGASEDELLEARAWMEGDSKDMAAGGFTPVGRVALLIGLLEDAEPAEE